MGSRTDVLCRARTPLATLLGLALVSMLAMPAFGADADNDGLRDGFESKYGVTSPTDRDSDGDGVIDSAEDNDGDKLGNLGEQRFGTHPGKRDSDGDGRSDGREDKDRDGRSNAQEQDQRPVPSGLRPSLARAPDDINKLKVWCSVIRRSAKLKRCEFGDPTSDITIVMFGDSHAMSYLLPAKRAVEQEGWHLITLLKGSCIPLIGLRNQTQHAVDRNKTCRTWRDDALAWLRDRGDAPDLIVVAHSDRYALVDAKGHRRPKHQWPQLWRSALKRTLEAMPEASDILVLGDAPKNSGNPVRCLRHHPKDISACVTPMKPRPERTIEGALRRGAEAAGAEFRTFYGKICTYDPCPIVQGDVLMWRDKTHLSATFTQNLTPSVRALLREVLP